MFAAIQDAAAAAETKVVTREKGSATADDSKSSVSERPEPAAYEGVEAPRMLSDPLEDLIAEILASQKDAASIPLWGQKRLLHRQFRPRSAARALQPSPPAQKATSPGG